MVFSDCAILPTSFVSQCTNKISPPSDAAALSSSDRMDVVGSRGQAWLTRPGLCMFNWPKYAPLATWPNPVWQRRAWWIKNIFCQVGSLLFMFFFLNEITPNNGGSISFTFSDLYFHSGTSADQACVINYPPNSLNHQKTAFLAPSSQSKSWLLAEIDSLLDFQLVRKTMQPLCYLKSQDKVGVFVVYKHFMYTLNTDLIITAIKQVKTVKDELVCHSKGLFLSFWGIGANAPISRLVFCAHFLSEQCG